MASWNFSNISWNVTTDPKIQNATNWSTWSSPFGSIQDTWIQVWHGWFYVYLTFVFTGMVLVKYRSIYPASIVLILLNAVMVIAMPPEVQNVMYLLVVLGIAGALYGYFEKR